MTDNTTPTRQAVAAKDRSGKLTVSGKLKTALDVMLYQGSCRADAAKAAGMTDHGLREAMKKPHVKRYYSEGLDVLRTSARARNIFALERVRDTSDNGMAVVSAAKALEGLAADEESRPTIKEIPGLQIVIVAPGASVAAKTINAVSSGSIEGSTNDFAITKHEQ
jgi:hypothetical protein